MQLQMTSVINDSFHLKDSIQATPPYGTVNYCFSK